MKLLPLTNDFTFKAVFSTEEDLLLDLLNSFPEFQGKNKILSLRVLNPEIPKDIKFDKTIVLDIKAIDQLGKKFLIEMQASEQLFFSKRVLFYWSKLYSKSIGKGEDYTKLPKIYSFNFLNFNLFKNEEQFFWNFRISDKEKPDFLLTEDFNVYIIELPKFKANLNSLQNPLDFWIYLLKKADNLKEEEMKILERKSPNLKKALNKLIFVSQDINSRELYEAKLKTERDYSARTAFLLQEAIEEEKLKAEARTAFLVQKEVNEKLQKVVHENKLETAKRLLTFGMEREQISQITGLNDSEF